VKIVGLAIVSGLAVVVTAGAIHASGQDLRQLAQQPQTFPKVWQETVSYWQRTTSNSASAPARALRAIPSPPAQVTSQLTTLSEKAEVVTEQTQLVLGEAIQVDGTATASDKSLSQKVVDHGLYLYCKQLVKEYETTNPPR
jgi:hypothetical protein